MRETIIKAIETQKIIVIVRGVEKSKLIPLSEAMYNGGIRLLEVTYNTASDEDTAESIDMLSKHFKNQMYIGAGTVLTQKQVELTKNAGGQFIISPNVCPDVIKKTRELSMVSMPGALTPTEIQQAHEYGADFVKLFPICNLGSEYIKAVKAPLSHIKFLAVGGINENNINEYLNTGIAGVGIGSNIVDKKLIDDENYFEITSLAKKYTEMIK